jgi:hypothetical protein
MAQGASRSIITVESGFKQTDLIKFLWLRCDDDDDAAEILIAVTSKTRADQGLVARSP